MKRSESSPPPRPFSEALLPQLASMQPSGPTLSVEQPGHPHPCSRLHHALNSLASSAQADTSPTTTTSMGSASAIPCQAASGSCSASRESSLRQQQSMHFARQHRASFRSAAEMASASASGDSREAERSEGLHLGGHASPTEARQR
jgi:hypothetical protein